MSLRCRWFIQMKISNMQLDRFLHLGERQRYLELTDLLMSVDLTYA